METVNDIIVDMRQRASVACAQAADAMVHHNSIGDMLVDIANRIEVAWKREKEAVELDALEAGVFVAEARARRSRRNCDRFATGEAEKAKAKFFSFCGDKHGCDVCPIGEVVKSGRLFGACIVAWLLAPCDDDAKCPEKDKQ